MYKEATLYLTTLIAAKTHSISIWSNPNTEKMNSPLPQKIKKKITIWQF